MTRPNTAIFTLLTLMATSFGSAQSVDPVEELKACASIIDRDARFTCLDNLGERVLQEELADKEPMREKAAQPETVITTPAKDVQPIPDDSGTPTIGEGQDSKSVKYNGIITSCKQGEFGDWYFIFDNGQVWKEVKQRNRRFDECNFNATITKDFFGYKMRIDALDKTIRVRRQK